MYNIDTRASVATLAMLATLTMQATTMMAPAINDVAGTCTGDDSNGNFYDDEKGNAGEQRMMEILPLKR